VECSLGCMTSDVVVGAWQLGLQEHGGVVILDHLPQFSPVIFLTMTCPQA